MVELDELQEILKAKPRSNEINRGILHEQRLRFHTETVLEKGELSEYKNDYISWISSEQPELLPSDKVARFKQLMTTPLQTVELTESIETSLSRVFDGQDAFHRYDFNDEEKLADWLEFKDDEFWKTRGVKAMMSAIDSVWVVDFDEEGEPGNLLIDITDVVDILTDSDGICHHVIFTAGDKIYVYDDESIREFERKEEEGGVVELGEMTDEYKHELDRCPAKMFWSEFLQHKNWINHKAPLTNVLGDLDWSLTHSIFKKYMDIGNSYPILVAYAPDGDSTDLTPTENEGRTQSEQKTAGGFNIGPGTVALMPLPRDGQPDLMANPVKWITPEVGALEFHVNESVRLTEAIYRSVVGDEGEQNNDMAKNEKQVISSFENPTTVLRKIAKNFEVIIAYAEGVIIELKYREKIEPSINMGSKFFLKTTADLMEEMDMTDEILFDVQHTELLDTRFRNDTAGRKRAEVIRDLDPLPGKTIEQAKIIYDSGGISKESFIIKANLMAFVKRFEREQQPIPKFVEDGDYNNKVNLITGKLNEYAKTTQVDSSESETDSSDQGEGSGLS